MRYDSCLQEAHRDIQGIMQSNDFVVKLYFEQNYFHAALRKWRQQCSSLGGICDKPCCIACEASD